MSITEIQNKIKESTEKQTSRDLILYNDDHNSFNHVIECLIEYCDHKRLQAEQCATIVHNKGKCSVKKDVYNKLEPIWLALLHNGLTAKIK
jgi:ATP-dependent Clp protease adaptor protein ClpS